MTKIVTRVFSGMRPMIGARLLKEWEAQAAENCKLFGGELSAWGRPTDVTTPTKAVNGDVLAIFRMSDGSTDYWLNWNTDVDCVRGPVAEDVTQRIYFTGDGEPRVSNLTLATSGSDFPTAWYVLGVYPPQTAPTVGNTGGSASNVSYAFCYTLVTAWGEESQPSPATVHTAPSDTTWNLSGMDVAPLNTYSISGASWSGGVLTLTVGSTYGLRAGENVTLSGLAPAVLNVDWEVATVPNGTTLTIEMDDPGSITDQTGTATRLAPHNTTSMKTRIYVSLTGTTDAEYQFWTEISPSATHSGTVTAASLGSILESTDYEMPPTDMRGIVEMPNGMAAAFSKNQILFAEPYKLHAWPAAYRQTVPRDVVGLGVYGSTVVAGTKAEPYSGTGSHPENVVMQRVEGMVEPCMSKRGVVSASFGVMYPSPNGLVLVGVGGATLSTDEIIEKDQWSQYSPTTMIAAAHRDRYFGWTGGDEIRGFIVDRSGKGPNLVDLSYVVTEAWADPETGELYIVHEGVVKKWNGDAVNILPFEWRSKVHVTPRPLNMACAQVMADFAALDETEAIAEQVAADAAANALILAESESWPGQGVTHGELGGAMLGEYMLGGSRLVGGLYPNIDGRSLLFRLYGDGDLLHSEQITDGRAFRVACDDKYRDWEIVLSGNVTVYSVEVADSMRELGNG